MKAPQFFIALSCLILTPLISYAKDTQPQQNNPIEELMVTSKFAGACGILKLQLDFQENTQIDNGNYFIQRFWSTEAARLGITVKEYVDQCFKSVELYNETRSIVLEEQKTQKD